MVFCGGCLVSVQVFAGEWTWPGQFWAYVQRATWGGHVECYGEGYAVVQEPFM